MKHTNLKGDWTLIDGVFVTKTSIHSKCEYIHVKFNNQTGYDETWHDTTENTMVKIDKPITEKYYEQSSPIAIHGIAPEKIKYGHVIAWHFTCENQKYTVLNDYYYLNDD